ncbi:hypothetical protein HY041_01345, partial [Candidatus Roizmanbacteria bacterium]|nr:hypothetical protein [Candidatus Roizmanbacteria bacterium]
LFSQSFFVSIYRYIKVVELLIVGFIAYQSVLKKKIVLLGFLAAGIFELVLSTFQLITKHSFQGIFYFFGERYINLSMPGIAKVSLQGVELLRPYGTFSHPNSLAGFFLLLYIWILINNRFNKYILLRYISLFVFSALILISFSKITILTYIILNVYYLYYRAGISCRLCKWGRLIILGIIGLLFMQARSDPLTIQKRFELLKNSIIIIFQYPITGVGIGSYLISQNQYVSKFSYFFNQPVHNVFLLGFAELGIPLGLYVMYLLFFSSKKLLTSHFLLLTVLVITCFFDHY